MVEDNLQDKIKDFIGAKYLKLDSSECFDEFSIFVVEWPVSDNGSPEVIAAKDKEISSLQTYETFEEWKMLDRN